MIVINLNKAKNICHDKRREARTKEFAPLDIQATIPFMAEEAETKRELIRQKYQIMQTEIDSASNLDALKSILNTLE